MRKINLSKSVAAIALVWTMIMMPLAAIGQTRIVAPKNKYKVQDDIKLGQDAARQVEQQMPILSDAEATRYVQRVGERLAAAIPAEYQHPEFRYTFEIVNASDINAFALPGGPMFVNRGMIEAAKNEGEMAGVMAHELSHVALRHGTAQATEVNKPINQILGIGAILGGAVLGGQSGAQLGQVFAQGYFTKFSRKYETQADTLGAQIMAEAGYDPRDLANMFKTIEAQGGSRTPEFLSDHPNPENRYENINREAQMLRIRNPVQNTAQFERIQSKLRGMPKAPSTAQIEQSGQGNGNGNGSGTSTMSNGKYESRVEYPSSRVRSYNGGFVTFSIPDNWQTVSESQSEVWFAPQGAYGSNGITRGTLVGTARGNGGSLQQETESYVNGILQAQGNDYLQADGDYSRTTIGGRSGLGIVLSGRSPITNRTEVTSIYTTQLRNGQLFYIVTVTPENESASYNSAFRNMLRSIRLNG